ncbi:MAG: recombinase family protein [Chloroflexota bacterium]
MTSETRAWLEGKRARGYLRVSTVPQADRYGPAAQRHDEELATRALRTAPLEVFYEDHVTGTNAIVRSDFQRMVADAAAKHFDVLVVGRVDRFARNERDAWNYLHELERAGVAVFFVEEDVLVPHDERWQDEIGGEVNAAAAYSRKLSRNVRKGLARKWASGSHAGGVPYGYSRIDDARRLVPNADAPIRALCFELYVTGRYTFDSLAAELNTRGHRLRGRPFTKISVNHILKNPIVIGEVRWHLHRDDEDARADAVERIVSPPMWESVQALMRRRGGRQDRVTRHRYVFSGITRCADCGQRLRGHFIRANSETSPARRDQVRYEHQRNGCAVGMISERKVLAAFDDFLRAWRLPTGAKVRVARYITEQRAQPDAAPRRAKLEADLGRVRKLYTWGDLPEPEYLAERRRIAAAIAALPPAEPQVSDDALGLIGRVGEVWEANDAAWRRRFVDEWFEELRIGGSGLELVPRAPYRELVYAALVEAALSGPPRLIQRG